MLQGSSLAIALFTSFTAVRMLGYIPQMIRITKDTQGAAAISSSTWIISALSHISTVLYAEFASNDPTMATAFAVNAACCIGIVALTAYKRMTFRSGGVVERGGVDHLGPGAVGLIQG